MITIFKVTAALNVLFGVALAATIPAGLKGQEGKIRAAYAALYVLWIAVLAVNVAACLKAARP